MQTRAPLSCYEYTEEGHTVVENALKRSHFTTIFKINNIHWINKISKSYKIDGIHMIRKIHKVRKTHKIRKIHKTFFLKIRRGPKLEGYAFANFGYSSETDGESHHKMGNSIWVSIAAM